MGEEKRIFGYARTVTSDQLNGQLLIKEDEAVVVNYVFSKLKEYLENPPKDLIRAVLDEHDTEDLTYEQAAKMVTFEAVLHQIADEVSEKWPDAGQKFAQSQGGGIQSLIDKPVAPFSASGPIISEETFKMAQQRLLDR